MFVALLTSSILVGLSVSSPVANYWLTPMGSLAPLNQYHTQDGSGSYRYGYTGPHHAKTETRSNGITQGGYSYVDANGILQTVAYSADAENGFRVRASNLPRSPVSENSVGPTEIPNSVTASQKIHHEHSSKFNNDLVVESNEKNSRKQFRDSQFGFSTVDTENNVDHSQVQRDTIAKNVPENVQQRILKLKNPFLLSDDEASRIEIPKPDSNLLKNDGNANEGFKNVGSTYVGDVGNFNVVPLPMVNRDRAHRPSASYVLPVVPYRLLHSSLHHTQDSLGQYDYSYVGDTSSKTESRSLDGTTRGAYSYVDANGLLQQVHYIADHNGFRVLATNLPEA